MSRDWLAWHGAYDESGSGLSQRLAIVRGHIRDYLDQARPGPLQAVSLCAGQGRDIIGVLAGHPRRADVSARLVELDARNVAEATSRVRAAGLDRVHVVAGDASDTTAYEGAVPADLVLLCGIFGNISDVDIHRMVTHTPMLCAPGARVIWTRNRRAPDLTPTIRGWFADGGFEEVAFDLVPGATQTVGVHRLAGSPEKLRPHVKLFDFVGYDRLTTD